MTAGPGQPRRRDGDLFHRNVYRGVRVHHLILTAAFLLLIVLGIYFITSQNAAVTRTAVSSYQETELEIVRDAARSAREYTYIQTVVLNRTDIGNIEQEIFVKFIDPIRLLKNGDAWIYAPDHVVFDVSSDFPDAYRGKSMAQIFEIQKSAGASHYESMTDDVMHAREGVGYYIWLPEKGEEIAAWTPVTVDNYTWTIGLSTPLPEILDATGAAATTRTSTMLYIVGIGIAAILFAAWLRADIRRWRSDEVLRESEERYAAIVNNTPGPVLILGNEVIRFINDAGVQASGYSREEIVGKDIFRFLTEDSQKVSRQAARDRAGNHHVSEYEVGFIRKDGRILNLIVRAIDLPFHGETVTLVLLVDITERKRADAALKTANQKLNLLSGITRHDIRNKLTVLAGYIALARNNPDDKALVADLTRKAEDTTKIISGLIAFTKDYEEMGIRSPAWQNTRDVVERILPQLPVRDIRIEAADLQAEVYADPLLERVFYNLIDNALRYGGEGMTTVRITQAKNNGDLVIAVEDNGTGIAAEDKPRLFTKGFGRNTGLGLFLSREILAITGITITETGKPGTGARFEMRVPAGVWRSGSGGDKTSSKSPV